ncbi:bifunctional methylenetetrahydrofolate dehydrogenase/methenyltetrahydrofolate cyclohydrolase FolD [Tenacibaculum sp. UWU-22]|uniref:bifunctional methylenetetrahydrofolate dehydrogenase/methenyltetrahydrofolate cyclohydrolase FolD n=1 Tax=Tenacibaculum sp. UWU-22 TaxID=3234187 RepID=UPI0034DAE801
MILLDGRKTAADIKEEIALEVAELKKQEKKVPHLAAIIVGNDGGSLTYVNAKVKACERVGFDSTLIRLPEDTSEEKLLNEIAKLNIDNEIDGFIVQLPLPEQIDEQKILLAIDSNKDVDGFHPANVGKMVLNLPTFLSATPYGILELLDRYDIETTGKHVVVIGRSHIVGSPVSILLSQKRKKGNATVTITHSRTKNLKEITSQADIIIAALGVPEFLKGDMVKDGVTVIDVGTSRIADPSKKSGFRLVGDVAFDEVSKKASYITPVPGGVGPMTIAMLLKNTLLANTKKHR